MRRRNALGMLAIALLFTGCAILRSGSAPNLKSCGDTPESAVAKFIQGLAELALAPIRAAIAGGMSVLGVFGGGDYTKGWEIVQQLVRHPEVLEPNSDFGRTFDLVEIEDLGSGESRVLLEREDLVTTHPDGRLGAETREVQKVFRRNFHVRFQSGTNCITAIRSLDPAWIRVR